jgi:hypothetical protein
MTAITGLDHPPARDLPIVTRVTVGARSSGYLGSKGRYDDMRFRTAALILAGLGLLLIPAMTADAQGRPQPTGTFDCQRILIDYFNSLPVNVLDQETTDFDDVNVIVQNMIAGSRNHMRSFFGALEQRGEIYEAQYIEQTLLDFIVSTPMETAVIYDENGDVLAECGRPR